MLTPTQIKAAELLSQGRSHQEVADSVGVSRRTILRWLKNSAEFKNWQYALISRPRPAEKPPKAPQAKIKADSLLKPSDLIQDALRTIQDILCDPDVRVSDRLRACALVGEWCDLKSDSGAAEIQAVKVLVEAEVLPQEVLDTIVEGSEQYIEKIKSSIRRQSEPGEVLPVEEIASDDDWDLD